MPELSAPDYDYRITTWRERREPGDWWVRRPIGDFARPIRLRGLA